MNPVKAGKRIMLRNILFTTDFSPCSDTALPYAVSLARKYGANFACSACDAHYGRSRVHVTGRLVHAHR